MITSDPETYAAFFIGDLFAPALTFGIVLLLELSSSEQADIANTNNRKNIDFVFMICECPTYYFIDKDLFTNAGNP